LQVTTLEERCLLSYTVTDLGTLGGDSEAWGINDAGQVVGESGARAFLWQDGLMADLGNLGGPGADAFAINDVGQVVGDSITASYSPHAFLWQDGVMTDLGNLGGNAAYALAINDVGQVVGSSTLSGNDLSPHAFLWQDGVMTDLGTLGGDFAWATGINEFGQVVGYSNSSGLYGPSHAFLWQNGVMTDLGTAFGYDASAADAINDAGQVVGALFADEFSRAALWQDGVWTALPARGNTSVAESINASGQVVGGWVNYYCNEFGCTWDPNSQCAFLYSGGTMTDLDSLILGSGWRLLEATHINDAGQIVGFGTNPLGQRRAFLLTPDGSFRGGPANSSVPADLGTVQLLASMSGQYPPAGPGNQPSDPVGSMTRDAKPVVAAVDAIFTNDRAAQPGVEVGRPTARDIPASLHNQKVGREDWMPPIPSIWSRSQTPVGERV
jgi:probable HAF family extracellular repeat protein